MQKLVQALKLTRPLNLLIIALTMWLMRYFVLRPMVVVNGFELQFSNLNFILLVLSTVLIAAAGNVINDYFDQRTDQINKGNDTIVGVHVTRKAAMGMHQVFNIIGLALSVWVAWSIGMWKLSILSFFAAGSLWFYSVQFKRDLIIGNVIIAFLAGLVPLIVGLYEIPLLIKTYGTEVVQFYAQHLPQVDPSTYFRYMLYFILGYSGFAFILNLIREIQKDMADVQGDLKIKAKTIPIVYGIKKAKYITAALIVFTMILLIYIQQEVINSPYTLIYLIIAILFPLALGLWFNQRAVSRSEFMRAGNLIKMAMLGGILYSIAHYYIYYAGDLI